ncbi:hypothetical protein niasHS_007705 [Heterodera schachtii]|uniref:Uncharacterized protein n=1 Tax=Heterodera schachtii TaxID=97005 RepID=A0ABD2JPF5_HETSC
MNCGSDPTVVKLRQCLQMTYYLVFLLFLTFCVYPLIKLARERLALYILISKLFPAFIMICSFFLGIDSVVRFVNIGQMVRQSLIIFGLVNYRLHIMALALNRAHALFFPFHYNEKVTKRVVLFQCVFFHLLSILFTVLAYFHPVISLYTWPYLIVSSSFYVAIAIRLAWIKAHNRSWNSEGASAQSSDKDSGRITATCFAIQIQAWAYVLINAATNYKWYSDFISCHPIGQIAFFPIQLFVCIYVIADELFLLMLCKEMRVIFVRMIGKVLPFVRKRNATEMAPFTTQYSSQMPKPNQTQHSKRQIRMIDVNNTVNHYAENKLRR